jgi:hypothetical protein
VVLRLDGREVVARLLGVVIDGRGDELEALLRGRAWPVLQPGGAVDADGTPLVEVHRDGRSLNEQVVRLGLGRVDARHEVPARLLERLRIAEREAREARRGTWAPPREATPPSEVEVPPARPTVPDQAEAAFPAGQSPSLVPTKFETSALPPDFPYLDEATEDRREGWPLPMMAWARPFLAWPATGDPIDLAGAGLLHVLLSALGSWVAVQKRRHLLEGLFLGLLFGPLGVMVEALLPVPFESPPASGRNTSREMTPTPAPSSAAVFTGPSPLAQYVAATSSGASSATSRTPGSQELQDLVSSSDWELHEKAPLALFFASDDDEPTASGLAGGGPDASTSSPAPVPEEAPGGQAS